MVFQVRPDRCPYFLSAGDRKRNDRYRAKVHVGFGQNSHRDRPSRQGGSRRERRMRMNDGCRIGSLLVDAAVEENFGTRLLAVKRFAVEIRDHEVLTIDVGFDCARGSNQDLVFAQSAGEIAFCRSD